MPACPTVCAGTRVRSKAFSFGSGRRLPRGSRAAEGAVARKPVRRRETAVQRGSVPRRKQEGRRVSFVTRRPVCVRLRAPLKRATYPSEWKEAGGGQKGEPPPSGVRRCRPGARKALDGGGTARPQWPQKSRAVGSPPPKRNNDTIGRPATLRHRRSWVTASHFLGIARSKPLLSSCPRVVRCTLDS